MSARLALWATAGCLVILTTGCATTAPPADTSSEAPAADSNAELEALYWERAEASRSRFTEADVQFMTGMIGHHAQALVMSAMAPTNAAGSQLRTLASRIENAQKDEIESMQRWLRDRDQPVPEVHIEGTMLMIHGAAGHHDHTMMPGMLTQAQLDELDAARGEDFDRLFLSYMIQHHNGAVLMVDELFRVDGAAQDDQAFKLASDIQVDQRTEVARMQRMLDSMSASNTP